MFPNIPQRTPREPRLSSRRSVVARTSRSRPARRARRFARRQPRRGVLLLVVLSLLVLFLMIGTAFVITAKQSEKSAKSAHKAASRLSSEAAQTELLDEVLFQVLRDTNNPSSSLRGHSLLGDMYGADVVKTRVAGANWAAAVADGSNPTGGQILELELDTSFVKDLAGVDIDGYGNLFVVPPPPQTAPPRFSPYDNAYNGQVLTFLSGPAKGRSTRIVGFVPPNRLRIMNFQLQGGTLIDNTILPTLATSRILINGRPFSGAGFGFNRAAADDAPKLNLLERLNLDSDATPLLGELALLPNSSFLDAARIWQDPSSPPTGTANEKIFASAGTLLSGAQLSYWNDPTNTTHVARRLELARQIGPAGIGGANESYDAVDYQNMALALIPGSDRIGESAVSVTDLANTSFALPQVLSFVPPPPSTDPAQPMIMPSWHRPELVNYWANRSEFASGADIRSSNLAGAAIALRRILLRPNWLDHPNFTGSNPEFAAIANTNNLVEWGQKLARMVYGPWDVDNDNDGVRDSIWVDVGLPVMAGPNGKLVKPLAAILIVDMDGRLNVNAHGTCDLAEVLSGVTLSATPPNPQLGILADGTTRTTATPRGVGYGPADISLLQAIGKEDFYRLFTGRYEATHASKAGQPVTKNNEAVGPGRYGQDDDTNFRPGKQREFDFLSQIERTGWPQWADGRNGGGRFTSSFATPPDVRARYGLALNYYGQPIFEASLQTELDRGTAWKNLTADSPYELNLSQKTAAGPHGYFAGSRAADAPFSVAELERVLRLYDVDAGALPSRLAFLSGVLPADNSPLGGLSDRLTLTTDSYDLPVPNVALPHEMESLVSQDPLFRRLPRSTSELFEIRIRAALGFAPFPEPLTGDPLNPGTPAGQVRVVMRRILAPELADGLRLNVNRSFGNGLDDNNNGVVDEPGETINGIYDGTPETPLLAFDMAAASMPVAASEFTRVTFPIAAQEVLPDGTVDSIDHRQYLARHLYTLALTLTAPSDYCLTAASPPAPRASNEREQDLARRLAQWAVNIVDFRDADNAMTPFEYDINPFDGWQVDGKIGGVSLRVAASDPIPTSDPLDHCGPDGVSDILRPKTLIDDTIVWGTENPELVITETLAWHDRRTDDDVAENPYPETGERELMIGAPAGQEPDDDFDQVYRPRGALFIEVYNPSEPRLAVSSDTHAVDVRPVNGAPTRVDLGVDLAATSEPAVGTDRVPVDDTSPVWRMTFYKRWLPNTRQAVPAEQASRWDPDYPDSTDPILHPIGSPDRSVYFSGFDPEELKIRQQVADPNALWDDDGVAYFNDNAVNRVPPVRPGRYLVIGSGDDRDGDGVYESPIGDRKKIGDEKKLRSIALDTRPRADKVRMMLPTGTVIADPTWNYLVQSPAENEEVAQAIPGVTSQSMTDVAIIDRVFDLEDNNDDGPAGTYSAIGGKNYGVRQRRLTLSEPALGYVSNFNGSKWSDTKQAYTSTTGFPAIDIPLDGPITEDDELSSELLEANMDRQGGQVPPHMRELDEVLSKIRRDEQADPINPLDPDPGASHSLIYLQRLANPLLPWNPPPAPAPNPRANGHNPKLAVNPYMTVDSNSANLTVFNSRGQANEGRRAREENDVDTNEAMRRFASHERGYTAVAADATLRTDADKMTSLWGNELPSITSERRAAGAADLKHGAVNRYRRLQQVEMDGTASSFAIYGLPFHTLGFTNATYQDRSLTPPAIQPDQPEGPQAIARKMKPKLPFDWLTWNNRPFISGNELLVVPRSRSSQLLREVSTLNPGSPYVKDAIPRKHRSRQQAPFGHLTNYFLEAESTDLVDPIPNVPTHLYRVLEFIHTPSLFVGTQNWLNPANFAAASLTDSLDPRFDRQAPFNQISEFRDPGRINLNTIFSKDVWEGIFHGSASRTGGANSAHVGPDFDDDFVKFRRGYSASDDDNTLALNSDFPTLFAKLYRSPDSGSFVPLDNLMTSGVEGTLLRPSPPVGAGGADSPLYSSLASQKFNDASRHAFFNFEPMIRLDNLTTTRSNVYAVWVTIGFFEVEEVPEWGDTAIATQNFNDDPQLYKRVYPDGYAFGREDGVDVGNIRRLRGFYVIDRTKMAGFEPGADHNVENTVRLRRRIE